jgi:hypothetical protein
MYKTDCTLRTIFSFYSGVAMKLSNKIAQVAMVLSALPVAATAGDAGTMYLMGSTNGVGLGYGVSVSQDWAVRGQFNAYKQAFHGNVGDFGAASRNQVDVDWSSFQVLADWYPSDNGFRLSGGVVANNNKIILSGTGATIGATPALAFSSQIKLAKGGISPYFGIGYSTRPKNAKGFGFIMDLGVMVQDPDVELTAVGATAADITAQKNKIQDAVSVLKNMPVFGIGVSYSF